MTEDERQALALFREVTADARGETASVELLKSCNWNVEQALALHLAPHDDIPAAPATSSLGALSAPLLPGQGPGQSSAATQGSVDSASSFTYSFISRVARGIKAIGASMFSLLCTFLFGPGGGAIGTSGAAFRRALQASYGQLMLPEFQEGSFSQAVSTARQELKLLVVYLHSEHARYSQSVCSDVLANEVIRTLLNENFILWGSDVARMEAHQVAQMIRVRQYPSFSVLLPASVEEIRVIGSLAGQIEADTVMALLASCMEEMESHRSEIVAQQVQRVEDRHLREQQDREYQEALEMDRRRAEQREQQQREEEEARRKAEDEQRKIQEEVERLQRAQQECEAKRRARAAALPVPGPDATARVAMRLPSGQRVDRKFLPGSTLQEVYDWAECVAFLPENADKGMEIPERFVLKTSFPVQELTQMNSTVDDLKLGGTNILLAAIEDD